MCPWQQWCFGRRWKGGVYLNIQATEVSQSMVGLCRLLIYCTVGSHHLELQQDQNRNQETEDSQTPKKVLQHG